MAEVFSRTEDEPVKLPSSSCSLEGWSVSALVHSSLSTPLGYHMPVKLSCSHGTWPVRSYMHVNGGCLQKQTSVIIVCIKSHRRIPDHIQFL